MSGEPERSDTIAAPDWWTEDEPATLDEVVAAIGDVDGTLEKLCERLDDLGQAVRSVAVGIGCIVGILFLEMLARYWR
jgi:hypothetical protein